MADAEVGFTEARRRLGELWDRVLAEGEAIRFTRRGSVPVVLLAADEHDGLLEAAHLLRSPINAARPLSALKRARASNSRAT